ncbi:hypothetical protein CPB85DRAFT_1496523 [Mucidula mucida]|nr:hypothetical protein CPB85DRAFT_1496523 [Mucidula mucida]
MHRTVVTHSHPWFIFFAITIIYLTWAGAIGLPSTSMASFYGLISTSLRESAAACGSRHYRAHLPRAQTGVHAEERFLGTDQAPSAVDMEWGVVLFAGRENPWEGVLRGRKATEDTQDIQPYTLVDDELESEWGLRESGLVDKFLLVRLGDAHSPKSI